MKLCQSFLALALVASQLLLVAKSEYSGIPRTFDFGAYVNKYSKSYKEVETLSRANIFYARTLGIFKLNSLYLAKKTSYFLRQNEFTDYTAKEAKRSVANNDIDLAPVHGSGLFPDLAADEYVDAYAASVDGDDIHDDYSQAAGGDEPQTGALSKPIVDFFHETGDDDLEPEEIVRELAHNSEVAERAARVIEPGVVKSSRDTSEIEKIPYKPIVPSSNKNYDPSMIPSQAWSDTVEIAGNNFADVMMKDFLSHLDPYPTPDRSPNDKAPTRSSFFAELVNTLKIYYDAFTGGPEAYLDSKRRGESDGARLEPETGGRSDKDKEVKRTAEKPIIDIDWRRTGCISRPKSQSKCNSCYAFATLDMLEYLYCRQKKTRTEFSVQYIVDCGHKAELNGCQGGKLSNVGVFVQKYGLQLGAAYPYSGIQQECPYDEAADARHESYSIKPFIVNWRMYSDINSWFEWIQKTPLIVGINMPSDFLAYAGGVHDGNDCTPGMVHAMLLVGSGREDGRTFWLLKNTFSDAWGEEGYFKLWKKAPLKCFNSVLVARARFPSDSDWVLV